MTSLPSSPKDAAAPTVARRPAHVQTILTKSLPAAIIEHQCHDHMVTVSVIDTV
jgi:hypothetical protein